MKKVIRLTESDLTRIVKRVINEQQSPKKTPVSSGNNLINKTVNFYSDPDNKNFYMHVWIKKIQKYSDGFRLTLGFVSKTHERTSLTLTLLFECDKNGFFTVEQYPKSLESSLDSKVGYHFKGKFVEKLYNENLRSELLKTICTTNKSGFGVPKATFAHNTGNQNNANFA